VKIIKRDAATYSNSRALFLRGRQLFCAIRAPVKLSRATQIAYWLVLPLILPFDMFELPPDFWLFL